MKYGDAGWLDASQTGIRCRAAFDRIDRPNRDPIYLKRRRIMNPLSKPSMKSQTGSTQPITEGTAVQDLFDKQRAYFATDVTKTYEWRIDQLNRLIRMLKDNYERFSGATGAAA